MPSTTIQQDPQSTCRSHSYDTLSMGLLNQGWSNHIISILIWWINNNLSLTPDANFSSYQYYLAKCSMWYHLELVIVLCTAPLQRVVTVSMILGSKFISLNMYQLIATSDLLSRVKFPPIINIMHLSNQHQYHGVAYPMCSLIGADFSPWFSGIYLAIKENGQRSSSLP